MLEHQYYTDHVLRCYGWFTGLPLSSHCLMFASSAGDSPTDRALLMLLCYATSPFLAARQDHKTLYYKSQKDAATRVAVARGDASSRARPKLLSDTRRKDLCRHRVYIVPYQYLQFCFITMRPLIGHITSLYIAHRSCSGACIISTSFRGTDPQGLSGL